MKHTAKTICEALKHRILHLDYLPGYRFTEQALCSEFEVSRIPVREALSMLIDMGLVDKVRNVGCRVRKLSLEDIDHLYELRTALELYAVEALAALDDAADRIDAVMKEWVEHSTFDDNEPIEPAFWADADERFHETLVNALGNPVLSKALKDVNEQLRFLRLKDITSHERLARTCDKHLKILVAIRNHEPQAARKQLHENILMGKANVQESFKEALMAAYASADG